MILLNTSLRSAVHSFYSRFDWGWGGGVGGGGGEMIGVGKLIKTVKENQQEHFGNVTRYSYSSAFVSEAGLTFCAEEKEY